MEQSLRQTAGRMAQNRLDAGVEFDGELRLNDMWGFGKNHYLRGKLLQETHQSDENDVDAEFGLYPTDRDLRRGIDTASWRSSSECDDESLV